MPETEARLPVGARVPLAAAAHAPPGTAGAVARRRSPVKAAIVTMRPHQWVKNLLVIAAAGAAGALGHDDVPLRVGLAFLAFCLLASGIYAVNDVRDVTEDRLHPRKRSRPVAAGELEETAALLLGSGLIATGLAMCAAIRPLLALVGAGYVGLTLSYTLLWRHLLVLDIVAIAGGFVLRAVAGGVAAPVALSRAFVVVVTGAAVFIAAGKRQSELSRTDAEQLAAPAGAAAASGRRRVLEGYTPGRLRRILGFSALVTLFAYCYWAFDVPLVNGVPWRPLTVIPFTVCLGRYWQLIAAGRGEAPDELLLADRLVTAGAVAWLVLFGLGVHAAG